MVSSFFSQPPAVSLLMMVLLWLLHLRRWVGCWARFAGGGAVRGAAGGPGRTSASAGLGGSPFLVLPFLRVPFPPKHRNDHKRAVHRGVQPYADQDLIPWK